MKAFITVCEVALVAILISCIAAVFFYEDRSASSLGAYFAANAIDDTGSQNIVTSIYLGYRAFDTLGETVVLLLAVAGVAVIRERKR